MKKIVAVLMLVFVLFSFSSCAGSPTSEQSNELPRMTVVTAPMGSGWYASTVLFSDIWMNDIEGLNVSVQEGGSIGNIRAVDEGIDANMGWAYTVDLADSFEGTGPFEKKTENIRFMANTWPVWLNVVVLEESGINSIEELASAKINVGAINTGSEVAAKRLLEAYGLTYENIKSNGGTVSYGSYSDASTQLGDKIVQAMMGGGSPDIPAVHEVEVTKNIKLLPASEEALQKIADLNLGYGIDLPLPANTYKGQTEDVPAVTYNGVMIVNKDVPDDVVYQLTKSIWENIDRFRQEQPARGNLMSLEHALDGFDVEKLHPGAARYYKEKGILD